MLRDPVYRPATAADSRFIAEMIDSASDGVALVEWSAEAQKSDRRSALDIGSEIYAAENGDYSYRNSWIAELAGRRAGMLLGFPMQAREPADAVSPPPFDGVDVLAPYKYLEAPGTWYICGVAVLPGYRRRGIGTGLMQIARDEARAHGYERLSLVVFAENTAAVRLYRRLGFATIDRAPIIAHPLIRCGGEALLMVAAVP